MPRTYTDEEKSTIWEGYETLSPEDRAKTDKLIGPPPSSQVAQPLPSTFTDPRDTSPWYQKALENWSRATESIALPKDYGRPEAKKDLRTLLEVVPPIVTTAVTGIPAGPAQIPVAVQMAKGPLWNLVQNIAPWLYRTTLTGATAGTGAAAANAIDPEHYVNPTTHALWTAGGQAAGEVGAHGLHKGVGATIGGETAQGATLRETMESRGAQAPIAMTTTSPFLRSTATLLEHVPGGGVLRNIRDKGQQLIDDALQMYSERFRGGAVSKRTPGMITPPPERSMLDLEAPLRPILPGRRQTTLDAQARLRPHLSMGTDQDLQQVPREVLRRVPEAIAQQQEVTNKAFAHLREVVNESPVDARALRSSLQHTPAPPGTQSLSIFHDLEDVKKSLAMLPDTITAEMAFDIRKRLTTILDEAQKLKGDPTQPLAIYVDRQLVPELGQTLTHVNRMLEGRMVNLQPLKEEARTILGGYEQGLQVPQAMMESQGRMGRVPTMEDPHILVARNLLEKPNFVQFDEAGQILSDLNALRRHPGMNIGNQPAEAGERLRELLWGNAQKNFEGELFKTSRVLDPNIEHTLRDAQALYEHGARLYNSPLMMQLSKASPDDVLTHIVQNERPEDLKALRFVLGDTLMDRVGSMWLRRVENVSTDTVTKVLSPTKVQERLQALTPIAEEELFSRGQISRLKVQLDRTAAMEQALTTTNPLVYQDLVKQMTLADASQVGEIRLSQLLEHSRDPVTQVVNFDAALKEIQELQSTDMAKVLWPGGKLQQIQQSLQQASALKQSLTTNDPLVLKELQRQAGTHWDTGGDLRLSDIFRKATDAHGHLDIGQALDGIHAIRGEAEQVLYGNKLAPLKEAMRKADAMEKALTVLDNPTLLKRYRQVVNDPVLWESVQNDALSGGFRVDARTRMIDGKHLLDHINTIQRNPDVARELFPNPRTLIELHHLGEAAMMFNTHGFEVPYAGRHYPFLVSFDPDGSPRVLGSRVIGAVAGLDVPGNWVMSHLLANPTVVRAITRGIHTPITTPQAGRVLGTLTGALKSAGYDLQPGDRPVPAQP